MTTGRSDCDTCATTSATPRITHSYCYTLCLPLLLSSRLPSFTQTQNKTKIPPSVSRPTVMPSGNTCAGQRPPDLIFSYLRGEARRLLISVRGGLLVRPAARGSTGSALSRSRRQSHNASIQIYKEGSDTQHFRNRNERRFVFIWQCTLAASQGDPVQVRRGVRGLPSEV